MFDFVRTKKNLANRHRVSHRVVRRLTEYKSEIAESEPYEIEFFGFKLLRCTHIHSISILLLHIWAFFKVKACQIWKYESVVVENVSMCIFPATSNVTAFSLSISLPPCETPALGSLVHVFVYTIFPWTVCSIGRLQFVTCMWIFHQATNARLSCFVCTYPSLSAHRIALDLSMRSQFSSLKMSINFLVFFRSSECSFGCSCD